MRGIGQRLDVVVGQDHARRRLDMRGEHGIGSGVADLGHHLVDGRGGEGARGSLPCGRAIITVVWRAKPPASKIWLQR